MLRGRVIARADALGYEKRRILPARARAHMHKYHTVERDRDEHAIRAHCVATARGSSDPTPHDLMA